MPSVGRGARAPRRFFLIETFTGYRHSWLGPDIVAGVTLAAVAIPECMGYTKIVATPVVTGLYTILLPIAAVAESAPRATWWSAPIPRRRPSSSPG